MIPALFAGLSWGRLALKALPWVLIAILAFALWGVWGWKEAADEKAKAFSEALDKAEAVNIENAQTMERLRRQQESDRRLAADAIKAAQDRAAAISKLKKDQRNAPDADDQLNNYWRDFLNRL